MYTDKIFELFFSFVKIKLKIHSFSLYFLFYIHLYNVPIFSISLSSSAIVSIIWISEDFNDELVVEEELVVEILLVEETCSEISVFATFKSYFLWLSRKRVASTTKAGIMLTNINKIQFGTATPERVTITLSLWL